MHAEEPLKYVYISLFPILKLLGLALLQKLYLDSYEKEVNVMF